MTTVLLVDNDQSFFQELSDKISKFTNEIIILFAESGHKACLIFDKNPNIDLVFLGGVYFFTDDKNKKNDGSKCFLDHVVRPCNNYDRTDNLVVAICENEDESRQLMERGCHTKTTKDEILGFLRDFIMG